MMYRTRVRAKLWMFAVLAVVLTTSVQAALVRQMNLEQMADNAGKIFRGTVLDVRQGSVRAGGGDLPTVTYILRVEEEFKGTFEVVKGQKIARVQMVGKMKSARQGNLRTQSALLELPTLQIGSDYLLLTTAPSAIGLSTTVGLGQGAFRLSGKPGQETALNENHNLGLFVQTGLKSAPAAPGPIPYSTLASALRGIVGH